MVTASSSATLPHFYLSRKLPLVEPSAVSNISRLLLKVPGHIPGHIPDPDYVQGIGKYHFISKYLLLKTSGSNFQGS